MATQCVRFSRFLCTRIFLSFKTTYAFSSVWHHYAFVLLAFLHRFRRLSRFPPYGVIMHVHPFKTPYRHPPLRRHYACVLLAYCETMHLFYTSLRVIFLCIMRVFRLSVSFKTPHAFSSVCDTLRMASQCMCFTRVSASI